MRKEKEKTKKRKRKEQGKKKERFLGSFIVLSHSRKLYKEKSSIK